MYALVFPGQGSQFKGMGEELFAKFPGQVAVAKEILGYCVKSLCLEDKEKKLLLTQYTQPAIYVVSALQFMAMRERGEQPTLVAGHSLGEYSALFAAGVFNFEEGLRAVKIRGELMGKANGGAMAAILGLDRKAVDRMLQQHGDGKVDVANYNTRTQTVISGQMKDVMALESPVTKAQARFIPLMVSAPFHSRYMQQASDAFEQSLASFDFMPPKLEVISSVLARPYQNVEEIRSTLAKQIRMSVRWVETMQYYLARNVQMVTEVGPGTVLTKMFAEIKEETSASELKDIKASIAGINKEEQPSLQKADVALEQRTTENITQTPRTGKAVVIDRSRLKLTPRQLLNVSPQAESTTSVKPEAAQVVADAGGEETVVSVPRYSTPVGEARPESHKDRNNASHKENNISSISEAGMRRNTTAAGRPPERQVALGSRRFCLDYGLKMPYVAGAMQQGISSAEMVIKLANAGLLGFFGTHRLPLDKVDESVKAMAANISAGVAYGINIVHLHDEQAVEKQLVDIALRYQLPVLEVSNYHTVDKNLLRYRFKGAHIQGGMPVLPNHLIVKTSRLETVELFMRPAPEDLITDLVHDGVLSQQEAEIARRMPVSGDICIESFAGWKSDNMASACLLPQVFALRELLQNKFSYPHSVRVGVAGGLGTPEAIAGAFFSGADFVVTGSINQCTVEANTSPVVKDILQGTKIYDTDFAPFVDLFETGVKAQVLRRGVFFPSRARKLYEIYCQMNSLDEMDENLKYSLETRYFKKSLSEIWNEICRTSDPMLIQKAKIQPKLKMSLIFKQYLKYGSRAALEGIEADKTNFQVFCGPAMGAFNEYVKGSAMESWDNRHVDDIGFKLMQEAEVYLQKRMEQLRGNSRYPEKWNSPVAT